MKLCSALMCWCLMLLFFYFFSSLVRFDRANCRSCYKTVLFLVETWCWHDCRFLVTVTFLLYSQMLTKQSIIFYLPAGETKTFVEKRQQSIGFLRVTKFQMNWLWLTLGKLMQKNCSYWDNDEFRDKYSANMSLMFNRKWQHVFNSGIN